MLNGIDRNVEKAPGKTRKRNGCLKWFLILFGITAFAFILLIGFYAYTLQFLPDVSNLRAKASQFETMRILDRKKNLLYEIIPTETGRRDYVTLDKISPYVLASVIAAEDQDYYNHPGFDLLAIFRAIFRNAEAGTTVSGASTITQQLARNLLIPQKERNERTISRKIREIILAAEITRQYSKDEILEIYLNENYYGNHAYGIEAAAQTYFRRSAINLDFAQSAFLIGLPQAPGYYDIFNNREAVLERLKTVLLLTYNLSSERKCISIRNGEKCVSVDPLMVNQAISEIENFSFSYQNIDMIYPHWVNYVYTLLEKQFGAEALYRSGYTVYTTLDPDLQDISEKVLYEQIHTLSGVNAYNGAVIILDPQNGDILAMAGSPDFDDTEHAGQINMAVSPRQPGSAIKPLIYASAFEKGWTPATLIWDVYTDFSPTGREEDRMYSPPYHPTNYDGKVHGPVLVREALASSLNIPAVKALQFTGLYDDPATAKEEGFIPFAKRLHVDSLNKAGFGLSVALGGGEVTLLELSNAYAVFANNGDYIPSRAILRIIDHEGNTVFSSREPVSEKVLKDEYAFQINSILSDDSARRLGFNTGSILNVSFPAAVKTGTTNDYRDNWAIGYNRNIVVGVWVGNADNSPMYGSTGFTGAAPIWHNIMEEAAQKDPDVKNGQFVRPSGIVDEMICAVSGTLPDENCRERKWEIFAKNQMPFSQNYGLVRQYYTDTWSGKLVSEACAQNAKLIKYLYVTEKEAQAWIRNNPEGRLWADLNDFSDLDFIPEGDILMPPCGTPVLDLISPADGMAVYDDHVDIIAVIYAPDGIYSYSVEFAAGSDPDNWHVIENSLREPHYSPEKITELYLGDIDDETCLIRLRMNREDGRYFEKVNTVIIQNDDSDPVPFIREYYTETETDREELDNAARYGFYYAGDYSELFFDNE